MANDLTLALKLIAEAQSAIKGVQAVNTEIGQTTAVVNKANSAAEGLGATLVTSSTEGGQAVEAMNTKLGQAQAEVDALKVKLASTKVPKGPIEDTAKLGDAARKSAQSAGMMAAQWNDVVMMTLAGQSPMQMAIQQGTQMTQAFSGKGAAGALKMLASGFMEMLNPMNLVVIAAIAVGGTLVQQLMAGGAQAKSLTDEIDSLSKAVDAYVTAAHNANAATDDLTKKYGTMEGAAVKALKALKDEADAKALKEIGATVDDLSLKFGSLNEEKGKAGFQVRENQLRAVQTQLGMARDQAQQFRQALQDLNGANGLQDQAAAAQKLDDLIMSAAGSEANLTDAARATRVELATIIEKISAMQGAIEATGGKLTEAKAITVDFAAAFNSVVTAAQAVIDAQPGSDFLSTAISRAQALAGWMWSAAGAAADFSNKQPGLRGPAGMGDASSAFSSRLSRDEALKAAELARHTPNLPGTAPGSGGSGGAARSDLQQMQDQAQKAMAALDLAVGAIQQKVAAGLMSTADATKGITDAKDTAANALAELIPQLEKLGPAGKISADTWRKALIDLAAQLKGVQTDTKGLGQTMADGFNAPFAAFLAGTKTASAAWDDFTSFIQQTIAQKLADKVTNEFLGPVLDGFFSMLHFAQGGVPGISDLSGQVLTKPTRFAMPGGGLGEAGEAGAEAVMPLKTGPNGLSVTALVGGHEVLLGLARGSDGKLGVEIPTWSSPAMTAPKRFAAGGVPGLMGAIGGASSGPGGPVTVNVTNNAPVATPNVSSRQEGNHRIIDVVIDAVRDAISSDIANGRGAVPGAMQAAFGLSRTGR